MKFWIFEVFGVNIPGFKFGMFLESDPAMSKHSLATLDFNGIKTLPETNI